MATTRIIPMHLNKGKTIQQSLSERLNYGKNPEKTEKSVTDIKQRRDTLSSQITAAEKRMNEIAVLQKHITNYLKTKDIYASYRQSGYSKKFYAEHEDEIKLCKASKQAFDVLGLSKIPPLKALRAEYAKLLAEKKSAYSEYYASKDEYRDALTYQANLAGLFGIDDRNEAQKEKQKEK